LDIGGSNIIGRQPEQEPPQDKLSIEAPCLANADKVPLNCTCGGIKKREGTRKGKRW